jgi:hypothetical protein
MMMCYDCIIRMLVKFVNQSSVLFSITTEIYIPVPLTEFWIKCLHHTAYLYLIRRQVTKHLHFWAIFQRAVTHVCVGILVIKGFYCVHSSQDLKMTKNASVFVLPAVENCFLLHLSCNTCAFCCRVHSNLPWISKITHKRLS